MGVLTAGSGTLFQWDDRQGAVLSNPVFVGAVLAEIKIIAPFVELPAKVLGLGSLPNGHGPPLPVKVAERMKAPMIIFAGNDLAECVQCDPLPRPHAGEGPVFPLEASGLIFVPLEPLVRRRKGGIQIFAQCPGHINRFDGKKIHPELKFLINKYF